MIIRAAHPLDARQMATLLSEIIALGGTTALTGQVSREDMLAWMTRAEGASAWYVAESADGDILGFQCIEPADYLPPDAAEIATFARAGQQGLGIGSQLFEATRIAARRLGYSWINANIRADNALGLAYYQSRGFEDYGRITAHAMADGTIVDKVLKRFIL